MSTAVNILLLVLAVAGMAWVVRLGISSASVDRALLAEEDGWAKQRSFPPEVRRVYDRRRVLILDSSRLRALGYTEVEHTVGSEPRAARRHQVLWRADRPPAQR